LNALEHDSTHVTESHAYTFQKRVPLVVSHVLICKLVCSVHTKFAKAASLDTYAL